MLLTTLYVGPPQRWELAVLLPYVSEQRGVSCVAECDLPG